MRKIVVLGCGVAGYHAARLLEEELAGRRRVQLTVLSARAHFVFSPLLSSVATGELEPDHVITPVDDAFGPQTEVIIDEVQRIDLEKKILFCEHRQIPFNYLLIATGTTRNTQAFEGADQLLSPSRLSDATAIQRQLEALETPSDRPLRFSVIGGSSSGVEWAAELATAMAIERGLSCQEGTLEIDLFEAGPRLLPDHSEQLAQVAQRTLEELGVRVHLNYVVRAADFESVTLEDGERREMDGVFNCAGRVGIALWGEQGFAIDEKGRILVDQELRVDQLHGVYAAGDAVAPLPDEPRASNPQVALQQGQLAARNLLADMSGRAKRPFSFEDRGDFVTLGRNNAILELRGLILEGRAAWLANRLYYTALMPRAFQKARLLIDWVARRARVSEGAPTGKALPQEATKKDDEEESSSS